MLASPVLPEDKNRRKRRRYGAVLRKLAGYRVTGGPRKCGRQLSLDEGDRLELINLALANKKLAEEAES